MNVRLARATLAACLLSLPCELLQSQQIAGTWYGTADARPDSGLPVSLRLSLEQRGDSIRASLSLPESRQVDLRIPSPYSDSASATYRNGRIRIEFTPDIGLGFIGGFVPRDEERIVFEGRLQAPDRLEGTLRITRYTSPITLRRASGTGNREIDATFRNPNDSLQLGGTLILPRAADRPAVVVFVAGSDPETRDVWRYEADRLAGAGVASLLYDKRGVGASSGASHNLASWDDLAGDLTGAITWLAGHPELVDTARIGIIGQSQGTWIIAKVAARDRRVKFMVSIAGSGISASAQETYRTGALMRNAGFPEPEIARAQEFQRRKFAVARTGLGWESLDSTIRQLRADSVRWFPGYGTGAAAGSLAVLRLYGVLQFNYDPVPDLERITAPTLVIMGERDLVFPPARVIELMERSLGRAGNRCVVSHIVPQSGHALTVVQYYQGRPFRRVINEAFLDLLTSWVPSARSACHRPG